MWYGRVATEGSHSCSLQSRLSPDVEDSALDREVARDSNQEVAVLLAVVGPLLAGLCPGRAHHQSQRHLDATHVIKKVTKDAFTKIPWSPLESL